MATTQLITRKNGSKAYRIRTARTKDRPERSVIWEVPSGWSARAIQRELKNQVKIFENAVASGGILTRAEKKEKEKQKAEERAKIQTFKEFTEKVFMPEIKLTRSENTRRIYQQILINHIWPVFGDMKISEIQPVQIEAYLDSLRLEKKLSSRTAKTHFTLLNRIFKKAKYLVSRNPITEVDRPQATEKERAKEKEVELFTSEELQHILKSLENEPLIWQCFISVLIDTGCRKGEANGLKWRDINFVKQEIKIERSLNHTGDAGIYEAKTKTGNVRVIPISSKTIELLKKLRAEQRNNKVILIDSFVFTKSNGIVMHPVEPEHYFQQFGKRYNVVHFHPHKLRHTAISHMLMSGADVKTVADIAGHANATTTLAVYAHSTADSRKKALETYREIVLKEEKQA